MSLRDRTRRKLREAAGLRHSLERLLATPDAELERSGRCTCEGAAVRCLLTGDAPSGVCRWCAEFCPAD